MRKLILICLLILPSYAMAQISTVYVTYNSDGCEYTQDRSGLVLAKKCPPQWNANGQDVAANKPAPKPKVEEKAKPIILDEAKRKDLRLAALELDNAKFRLKEAQDNVAKAENAVADFWRSVGIANPSELATKWEASNGQNGDIILLPKKEAEKPKQ